MKKYILLLACAAFLTACKKVQEGGNKGVIKQTEDVVSYKDPNAPEPTFVEKAAAPRTEVVSTAIMPVKTDSAKTVEPVVES